MLHMNSLKCRLQTPHLAALTHICTVVLAATHTLHSITGPLTPVLLVKFITENTTTASSDKALFFLFKKMQRKHWMNSNKYKTLDLKTLQCPFRTSLSFTMTKSLLWNVNKIFFYFLFGCLSQLYVDINLAQGGWM